MADGFSISVDTKAIADLFGRVGPSVEFHARDVARDTAKRIVARAVHNVPKRTGKTADRIHWEQTYDQRGYVAMSYSRETRAEQERTRRRKPGATYGQRHREAHVDLYLEFGTKVMYKRPFFFRAAHDESAGFLRRLEDRLRTVVRDLER